VPEKRSGALGALSQGSLDAGTESEIGLAVEVGVEKLLGVIAGHGLRPPF
jgi:hypothetical protein